MAGKIIHPDQLGPNQTSRILQFLNQVSSAQQIAEVVGLAGESDIGIALAQRILHHRERLGGKFTTLQQITEIPYIGPERFSDLVRAIIGEDNEALQPKLDELAAEIATLRQQLAVLSQKAAQLPIRFQTIGAASQKLILTVEQGRLYLGQSTLLKATLTDIESNGLLAGHPITFFCQWGQLRSVNQSQRQQGSGITVTTGSDGVARVALEPLASQLLVTQQRDALISALSKLPVSAPTPQDAVEELHVLAEKYRADIHEKLRQAIDVYLRYYHPDLFDSVNSRNHFADWRKQQIAVMAMAQGGRTTTPLGPIQGDSSVQVSAIVNLTIVDWLPAWLEVFISLMDEESQLRDNLGSIKNLEDGKYSLTRMVDYYINDFATRLHGLAGDYAGKRIIGKALDSVIQQELTQLKPQTQNSFYNDLASASKMLAVNGVTGIQSVRQSRLALEQKIGRDFTSKSDFGLLQSELRQTNTALGSLQTLVDTNFTGLATKSELGAMQANMQDQLVTKADAAALNDLRASLSDLSTDVNSRFAQTATKPELAALQESVDIRLNGLVTKGELNTVRNLLQQRINSKADATAIDRINRSISDLHETFDRRLDNTVTHVELTTAVSDFQHTLDSKASKSDLQKLNTNLKNEIKSNNTRLNNKLSSEVNKLSTRIDGIRIPTPRRPP